MRVYVDTEVMYDVVRANMPFAGRATSRILKGGVTTVISDLTRMECSVIAQRSGSTQVIRDFEIFLAPAEVLTLTAAVFDRAAEIRIAHNFAVIDSLHLATAAIHNGDEFLTRNRRLSAYKGVPVFVI